MLANPDLVGVADAIEPHQIGRRHAVIACDQRQCFAAYDGIVAIIAGQHIGQCRRHRLRRGAAARDRQFLTNKDHVGVGNAVVVGEFLQRQAVVLGDGREVFATANNMHPLLRPSRTGGDDQYD